MNTPNIINSGKVNVLLLAFNRPVITQMVLDAIAGYGPAHLYIAVDGPRANNTNDVEKSGMIKQIVAEWQSRYPATQVHTLYQESNLGCGRGVSAGISWFFSEQEMGIILEDDCIPNSSFFFFCESMLLQYAGNPQVMHINGSSFLDHKISIDASYYFSKHVLVWGWATWKRAWQQYQFDMPRFNELLELPEFNKYHDRDMFIETKNKQLDTWDCQWSYTVLINKGFSIMPAVNLIKNVGFNEQAGVHLTQKPKWYTEETGELKALQHPKTLIQNETADEYISGKLHRGGLRRKIKKMLLKILRSAK
jgi:hypothetical protein